MLGEFGVIQGVPESLPSEAIGWFALLQENRLIGLTLLDVFDRVEYVLMGLVFLALYFALREDRRNAVLIATVMGLIGAAVSFVLNQALAMEALSQQYAAATTDQQRLILLADGERLLAIHNPGVIYQGVSFYVGLFLVLLAGLAFSIVMLGSRNFSKLCAVAGILANGFGLGYFAILPFSPALIALPFVLSAPFRMVWYFTIALRLFKLGSSKIS